MVFVGVAAQPSSAPPWMPVMLPKDAVIEDCPTTVAPPAEAPKVSNAVVVTPGCPGSTLNKAGAPDRKMKPPPPPPPGPCRSPG